MRFVARVSSTIFEIRVPLLVAGFAYFIFSTPSQIYELYFILASDIREWRASCRCYLLNAPLSFGAEMDSKSISEANRSIPNALRANWGR